jgi:hypothetical protein
MTTTGRFRSDNFPPFAHSLLREAGRERHQVRHIQRARFLGLRRGPRCVPQVSHRCAGGNVTINKLEWLDEFRLL